MSNSGDYSVLLKDNQHINSYVINIFITSPKLFSPLSVFFGTDLVKGEDQYFLITFLNIVR